MNAAVDFLSVTKRFGSFTANESISFSIPHSTIHCILGENGAGKSTLMKILYGDLLPDSGTIKVHNKDVNFKNSSDAINAGIGMSYQHFMQFKSLTALENIILGKEPVTNGFINLELSEKIIKGYMDEYSLSIPLHKPADKLDIGSRQIIEILKMLYHNASIMIFDEPTAVLSPGQVDSLLKLLNKLKENGKTIILITHKLSEVEKAADNITILRKGKIVYEVSKSEFNYDIIASKIAETSLSKKYDKDYVPVSNAISFVNVFYKSESVLNGLSITFKRGQIHGICGVEGNGQNALVSLLMQFEIPDSGKIDFNNNSISLIPDDRATKGFIKEFNIAENFLLKQKKFQTIRNKDLEKLSESFIVKYNISSPNYEAPLENLSGGNQQKAIAGREIDMNSDVLIAWQPTRGIDVSSSNEIYNKLINIRNSGVCIVLISSDVDEILTLSDEISVIYNGRIIKHFHRELLSSSSNELILKQISLAMIGIDEK